MFSRNAHKWLDTLRPMAHGNANPWLPHHCLMLVTINYISTVLLILIRSSCNIFSVLIASLRDFYLQLSCKSIKWMDLRVSFLGFALFVHQNLRHSNFFTSDDFVLCLCAYCKSFETASCEGMGLFKSPFIKGCYRRNHWQYRKVRNMFSSLPRQRRSSKVSKQKTTWFYNSVCEDMGVRDV